MAAAVMLVNGPATAHSWYSKECCHDKDCHPVACEEIEKIGNGWLWRDKATTQRHWFRAALRARSRRRIVAIVLTHAAERLHGRRLR
jgi:hypothetical protein